MNKNSDRGALFVNPANLIIILLISLLGLVSGLFITTLQKQQQQQQAKLLVKKTDRFSCTQHPDPHYGIVWAVMYDNDINNSPWLKMVIEMGGGWDEESRCFEIAKRLEGFRKDGLIGLDYRSDSNTPNQEIICAKTRQRSDCPLVLTLNVGVAGNQARDKIFDALVNGNFTYQDSNGRLVTSSKQSWPINLEAFLADEDKLAGK
ncbi:MAG: COP23 domain-containing protein [Microcoleaceae cyanobacterium]